MLRFKLKRAFKQMSKTRILIYCTLFLILGISSVSLFKMYALSFSSTNIVTGQSSNNGMTSTTVTIDDVENDYNYYMGLNYSEIYDIGDKLDPVSSNQYSKENLVVVNINYSGTNYENRDDEKNNSNTGYLSYKENERTVSEIHISKMYPIVMFNKKNVVDITLLDNPFTFRPTKNNNIQGFNGWFINSVSDKEGEIEGAYVLLDSERYERHLYIPVDYINQSDITINLNASWIDAVYQEYDSSSFDKSYYEDYNMTQVYNMRNDLLTFDEYGNISGYKGPYLFSGPFVGLYYKDKYNENNAQYYYDYNGNSCLNVDCYSWNDYFRIINPGDLDSIEEFNEIFYKDQYNSALYKLNTRDTNILGIYENINQSVFTNVSDKPLTITSSPDGRSFSNYVNDDSVGSIYINNDITIENMNFKRYYPDDEDVVNNRSVIYGNNHNLKLGRNLNTVEEGNIVFRGVYYGSYNSTYNNKKNIIIESGKYFFTAGGTGASGITNTSSNSYKVQLGNDIDRAINDNDSLQVYFCAMGQYNGTNQETDDYSPSLYVTVKSGKYGYYNESEVLTNQNYASYGIYVGGRGNSKSSWYDILVQEGGEVAHVIGGPTSNDNKDVIRTGYYLKSGVAEYVFGGASESETYGNRIISITGGTVVYAVFGGSNSYKANYSTQPQAGTLRGSTFIYIGGNGNVGYSGIDLKSNYYEIPGSVYGAGDGQSGKNYEKMGSVDSAYIIIEGKSNIYGSVYGGGNYGSTGKLDTVGTETNINVTGGTIHGNLFGSSRENGSGVVGKITVSEYTNSVLYYHWYDWIDVGGTIPDKVHAVHTNNLDDGLKEGTERYFETYLYDDTPVPEGGITCTTDNVGYNKTKNKCIVLINKVPPGTDISYYKRNASAHDSQTFWDYDTSIANDWNTRWFVQAARTLEPDLYNFSWYIAKDQRETYGTEAHTINMNISGGTINGSVYGGSDTGGTVFANVYLNLSGGEVANDVFGAGKGANTYVSGNVKIELSDSFKSKTLYGGSEEGKVNMAAEGTEDMERTISISIDGGFVDNLFGGSKGSTNSSPINYGAINVYLNSGENVKNIYGGNNYSGTALKNSTVYLNGGHVDNVYGGSKSAGFDETTVYLNGADIDNLFGGSNEAGIVNKSNVYVLNGHADNVYGGNNAGGSTTNPKVVLNGGTVGASYGCGYGALTSCNSVFTLVNGIESPSAEIYGGGYESAISTPTKVIVNKGSVGKVFGGNNNAGNINVTNVYVNNGTVNEVYGGNNAGGTVTSTNVNIGNGTIGSVYGAGLGSGTTTNNTSVHVYNGVINSVFGGGNQTGASSSDVNVHGGSVTEVYGGSNNNGTVTTTNVNIGNNVPDNQVELGGESSSSSSEEIENDDPCIIKNELNKEYKVENFSSLTNSTYSNDLKVGDDFFTLKPNFTISDNGLEFGGVGNINSKSIVFNIDDISSEGTIVMNAKSHSSVLRTIALRDENGNDVGSTCSVQSSYVDCIFHFDSVGTYYLTSTSGGVDIKSINLTYSVIEKDYSLCESGSDIPAGEFSEKTIHEKEEWVFNSKYDFNGDYSASKPYNTKYNSLNLEPGSNGKIDYIDVSTTTYDNVSFGTVIKMDNASQRNNDILVVDVPSNATDAKLDLGFYCPNGTCYILAQLSEYDSDTILDSNYKILRKGRGSTAQFTNLNAGTKYKVKFSGTLHLYRANLEYDHIELTNGPLTKDSDGNVINWNNVKIEPELSWGTDILNAYNFYLYGNAEGQVELNAYVTDYMSKLTNYRDVLSTYYAITKVRLYVENPYDFAIKDYKIKLYSKSSKIDFLHYNGKQNNANSFVNHIESSGEDDYYYINSTRTFVWYGTDYINEIPAHFKGYINYAMDNNNSNGDQDFFYIFSNISPYRIQVIVDWDQTFNYVPTIDPGDIESGSGSASSLVDTKFSSTVYKAGKLNVTNVYGGNNAGGNTVNGNVTLFNKSAVTNTYGGGNIADSGSANVLVKGGNNKNVYGGGKNATVSNNAIVNYLDGTSDYIYGGGEQGNVLGNTTVNIYNGTINKNVYGSGNSANTGDNSNNNNAISKVNILGGTILGDIYGGAFSQVVYGTTVVNIGQATIFNENLSYPFSNQIVLGGDIYGGGQTSSSGSDKMDFSFVSVTKGSTINLDPSYSNKFEFSGSVFGSGNNSIVSDMFNTNAIVNIKNFGNENNPYTINSIQRADKVNLENNYLRILGSEDSTLSIVTSSKLLFAFNRINNLYMIDNNELYLNNGANILKNLHSVVRDENDNLVKEEVKLTVDKDDDGKVIYNEDGSARNNVIQSITGHNEIYMASSKVLNVWQTETAQANAEGNVYGMAFLGIFSYDADNNKIIKGIYKSNLTPGASVSDDDYNQFAGGGTYVYGKRYNSHDITVDGYYTNYVDDSDNKKVRVDYVKPTPENASYYMWTIGVISTHFEVNLNASKYSTLGAALLPLTTFENPDAEFWVTRVDTSNIQNGVDLIPKESVKKVADSVSIANTNIGLSMDTGTASGWKTNVSTDFMEINSITGGTKYDSDSTNATPTLSFYLHHSKNVDYELAEYDGDLGYVVIYMEARIPDPNNPTKYEVRTIDITVNMSIIEDGEDGYGSAIAPGKKYSVFPGTLTNITYNSSFSIYENLYIDLNGKMKKTPASYNESTDQYTCPEGYTLTFDPDVDDLNEVAKNCEAPFDVDKDLYPTGAYRQLASKMLFPNGTTITMIDLVTNEYYTYTVDYKNYYVKKDEYNRNGEVNYYLKDFIKMGTITEENVYDEEAHNSIYHVTENGQDYALEEFVFIVDFYNVFDDGIEGDISNFIVDNSTFYLELMSPETVATGKNKQLMIPVSDDLGKMYYNIFLTDFNGIQTDAEFTDDTVYSDQLTTLNVNTSIVKEYDNNGTIQTVNNTLYDDYKLGAKITIYDENGNKLDGSTLLGLSFTLNDKKYYPSIDGSTRITLADKVTTIKSSILVDVGNSNLTTGRYKFVIETFGSYDGIYNNNGEPSTISECYLYVVNNKFGLNITLDDVSVTHDMETGQDEDGNSVINYHLETSSGLSKPNLRISLDRRIYPEVQNNDTSVYYDLRYETVDLADYVKDASTLIKSDDNTTYIDYHYIVPNAFYNVDVDGPNGNVLNIKELDYSIELGTNLKSGTYRVVFSVYDGDVYIGEAYKYLIIRKM